MPSATTTLAWHFRPRSRCSCWCCSSRNKLDGYHEHLQCCNCVPQLFPTRAQAREYIEIRYGYLRNRPDLKAEPHGWLMPLAVRVEVRRVE